MTTNFLLASVFSYIRYSAAAAAAVLTNRVVLHNVIAVTSLQNGKAGHNDLACMQLTRSLHHEKNTNKKKMLSFLDATTHLYKRSCLSARPSRVIFKSKKSCF